MSVPDCIDEYKHLGEEVFGRPRFFSTSRFGFGNRTKYKAAILERVFIDISRRRDGDRSPLPERSRTFPSGRGLCKT